MNEHNTYEDVAAIDTQNIDWLRQLPGFTGTDRRQDAAGHWYLLIKFDPLTPAIQRAVEEKYKGYPVKVVQFTMPSANPPRLPVPPHRLKG